MPKQHINPPELFNSTQYGFSQVVVSTPGRMVFVSGQVAWDAHQQIVGGMDLEQQTRQAFANLKTALGKAGASMKDIVMLRTYIVGYTPDESGPAVGNVFREFLGTTNPPASTWIGVESLARKEFLIEIEAQAIVDP
jgi:2-iminobutanoate/2-iminopropanoate deaminase